MHNFIVIKYGIVFWGNFSNSGRIFTLQKKIIRIIAGAQLVTSCRSLLKELQILPVPYLCILSLMNFIISYQENFQTNASIHNINTRNNHHFHRPNPTYLVFKKVNSILA